VSEGTIIGVDLGGTKVKVGVVAAGWSRARFSRPISGGAAERVVLDEIMAAIGELFDDQVVGIGLRGAERGRRLNWHRLRGGEHPVLEAGPLKAVLEGRFGVPTYVNNDGQRLRRRRALLRQRAGLSRPGRDDAGHRPRHRRDHRRPPAQRRNCCAGEIGAMPHKG